MNKQDYLNPAAPRKELPQLIKKSTTYKMFIPKKVEEKIRYLIRKFPHTEWSGVLFIKHTGSFEDNNLEIYCEDIYPMDLGTSGWTEFKMTEDVSSYMAENIELFDCDLALIHSHHNIGAFFSAQDINTLQVEGNDTNCFVSLIVDTKGTYQAAITRKVQNKTEVVRKTLGQSYEFFGDGTVVTDEDPMSETTQVINDEIIEYFMLDIDKEEVDNPLDFLDRRFEEIEKKKSESTKSTSFGINNFPSTWTNNSKDSFSWLTDYKKENYKENDLFSWKKEEDDFSADVTDPKRIHEMVAHMILCSLIADTSKVDLKQWITKHMKKMYTKMFKADNSFGAWCEFAIDYLMDEYVNDEYSEDLGLTIGEFREAVALAMIDELGKYPSNDYMELYKDSLTVFIYE